MPKLQGKIAVVTGGTAGIGLAAARRLAAEGARVFISGRRQAELDAAVAQIGGNAVGVRGDMADLADIDRLYQAVAQLGGGLDVLFANAGSGEFVPLGEITEAHFDRTFNLNVRGLLFTVQKSLPLFRDGGSIILNASATASTANAAFSVYSASKAAVRAFARCWMLELKQRRIRVNAISPGPVDTPGLAGLWPSQEQGARIRIALAEHIPLGRLGDPDEVAKAVAFLASDDSGFITGTELFVDGGLAQL